MSKFDFSKTVGGQILADSLKGWAECLFIDSKELPEHFRGKKSATSFKSIINKLEAIDEVKARVNDKAQKLANIAKYRQMIEDGQEIEYDVNEDKQYRKQQAFVGVMIVAGVIEEV